MLSVTKTIFVFADLQLPCGELTQIVNIKLDLRPYPSHQYKFLGYKEDGMQQVLNFVHWVSFPSKTDLEEGLENIY